MKINLILTDGGAGDLMCQLVAVDYNIRYNPKISFQVWVPDYLREFTIHVLPNTAHVKPFSKASEAFNKTLKGRTTQWFEHGHTPMRTHPVDYGFHMLADKHIYDMKEKNYLRIRPQRKNVTKYDLPEKYICIATTAAEPVKSFSSNTINTIIDYIKATGHTPVFLGKEESDCGFQDFKVKAKIIEADYSKGINLINKTNLLEAAEVISFSQAYIGMDGGLTHLAGFTDVNIIAGYTLVDPIHVAPIRNGSQMYKFFPVEPDKNIPNRYFQTRNSFYDKDYRVFPGWEKVVANLTADKFMYQINKALALDE